MYATRDHLKKVIIRLSYFISICLLSGCSLFSGRDGPALIDFVDRVHYEAVNADEICPLMGSDTNLCLKPLELVFTWRSGYIDHKGFSCCLDCERYVPACQYGNRVVEFSTGNFPLAPRERVPAHDPEAGMVIWEREGGVPDPLVNWCPGGCNDDNSCTVDTCQELVGCVYENIDGQTCQENMCFEPGLCSNGACVSGDALDCDDGNICTEDICDPNEFGCVNLEYNHMISNEFPDDCIMVACFGDEIWEDFPANDEIPPQASETDCELQFCSDGEILTADNPEEPGCEQLPDP
jgi:hypothetical protein